MTGEHPHFLARPFQGERSFWVLATLLFGTFSILKGFRAPNLWAATQAQFDYSQGFVKRGLFGATVNPILHLNQHHRFALFSTAVFALFLILLFALARSSGIIERLGNAQALAVFAASYTLAYLAHLNGYLDIVLAILTVGVLSVRNVSLRLILAVPAVVVGLLIHELFLLVFLPVILLSFVLEAWSERTAAKRSRIVVGTVLIALVALGVTIRLALYAPLSPEAMTRALATSQAHADFPLRPDVFRVLNVSAGGNVRIMAKFLKGGYWWKQQATGLLLYLPFVGFTLYVIGRLIDGCAGPGKAAILACCTLAALCPLLMNLFGWDIGRWYALTGLTIFLVFCTFCRFVPGASPGLTPAVQRAGWLVIAIGLASGGMLMDNRTVTPYPFVTTGLGKAWSAPVFAPL